ncbi:uncharacterized protein LOC110187192 [Drosophila serrata]|uniref:uncharacterized protein LOC110187192 n=1 Tax=Drosophila serrata TaxID=7274 RepID=UPI000A1D1827|nr:uncharacterized protein LOC110187192 [Drosophila serrata]
METNIEYICCNQAPSSSSSTNIFCDGEKLCSPCGCYRCCKSAFFNDHTYSILKRICHKIIKNHNRQRCRENYSVFDGGNSTIFRPVVKGQKDGADLFNNCMATESVFRRNGYKEKKNEDVHVPDSKINGKGNASWYENMGKRLNSKKPYLSGQNNENNIGGETKMIRKGTIRDEKGKKNGETVPQNHIDVFENGPIKFNKETNKKDAKESKKRKAGADYDKDESKKSASVKALDRNYDIDEKHGRDKNQGITEGRDRKSRESKAKQIKVENNVDQGEINKNEEKGGKNGKNRTSKTKQPKLKRM